MIDKVGPLSTLLRVKRLKEQNAEREARAKREAEARAQAEAERAKAMVRESKATLADRKDAIYGKIIGQVVNLDKIESTKAEEVQEEKRHQKLEDEQTRRAHLHQEAAETRKAADLHLRSTRIAVEKYKTLTELTQAEQDAVQELREEIEIEESFSTRRRSLLWA
jgi:type III secretion system (T3SS) protein YscO